MVKKMMQQSKANTNTEKGSVIVLVAVTLALMMISIAMTADVGLVLLTKNELQNAADAAALAGAAQLIDEDYLTGSPDPTDDIIDARDSAEQYANYNQARKQPILLDRNDSNDIEGGIVVGFIDNPFDLESSFQTEDVDEYNSVLVKTELSQNINGPLSLLFSAFTGIDTINVKATTVASINDHILGFHVEAGGRLPLLPFTVYVHAFNEAVDHDNHPPDNPCLHEPDVDHYAYSEETGSVSECYGDGIPELKLYPNSTDVCDLPQASGNFGTIDIGPENNSTSDLIDQILNGVKAEDLEMAGGMILNDDDGDGIYSRWFNADPGVSTAIKSALTDIIGQRRIISLHRDVTGSGDGTYYEVIRFVSVRVMDVHMTGKLANRHVTVQPCHFVIDNAIVHPDGPKSGYVYGMAITR